MELNEDGIELGKPVDFATIQRVESEQRAKRYAELDAQKAAEPETPVYEQAAELELSSRGRKRRG